MRTRFYLLYILSLCLLRAQSDELCAFHDLSPPIQSILCGVEKGFLTITLKDDKSKECWLGKKYCTEAVKVPLQSEVPPSPPIEESSNLQYRELAQRAESIIPKTWWREGFADEKLVLTKNLGYLPKKLLDMRSESNRKLKSLHRCVSRTHFMRQSFDYANYKPKPNTNTSHICKAMEDGVVKTFFKLWNIHREDLDGSYSLGRDNRTSIWFPKRSNRSYLTKTASYVLEYFYAHYSSVHACFGLVEYMDCRGALAGECFCDHSI